LTEPVKPGCPLMAIVTGVVAVPTCAETEDGERASEKSGGGGEEGEEPPQLVVTHNNALRASSTAAVLRAPPGPATGHRWPSIQIAAESLTGSSASCKKYQCPKHVLLRCQFPILMQQPDSP
jgi:hypothetical protein